MVSLNYDAFSPKVYSNLPNNRVGPFNRVDFSEIDKRAGLNKAV